VHLIKIKLKSHPNGTKSSRCSRYPDFLPSFPPENLQDRNRCRENRERSRERAGRDRGEIRRFVLIRGLKRPRGQFSSGLKAGDGITRGKAPGEIYRRGLR